MRFGYEKSFTSRQIKTIFGQAGFRNIKAGLFKTYYRLEKIPSNSLKKLNNHSFQFFEIFLANDLH